ncbi:NAD(P) transhydrogenase subunit alpha [Terrimicrobium sacchariphilum]|uniref:proton-translocating NAD(P)(+) transhydrogenase n=1 Tax=Terrimicrobium sacchariphilum TaxID=690879 RepID=A0A146G3X2_TERSA|nr:Re/Si-specific NAD(P)(+) transhydrogenase subunit alpha [Terrimicrobium sacchariphilum]GAT31734.1 NAD(P) transhydrogenase subunit alpha [Terrimicrobium sacchariphilum]
MKISSPKESHPGETRAPLTPDSVAKLVKLGAEVSVEAGIGLPAGFPDEMYAKAGATISTDRASLLSSADIVLRLRKPPMEEIDLLKPGSLHLSLLDPFNEKELLAKFAARGVSAISMEFVPRTTRAQKMDVLSSQANLAGYEAVILAARYSNKIFPMMTTAAGTILPARVFIIGVGVAGLQAIATAKRLGAKVTAYDTRPVVEEQVKSLGAQFLKVDLGETGQTKDGYAKALTDEQIQKQRDTMTKTCSESDIVITAAQVFGRRAPILLTSAMVAAMKPGSVVVDLAVETGGNVEGIEYDQVTTRDGVLLVGTANLPGRVPFHASQVYAANLVGLLEEYWDKKEKTFTLNLEDEIIRGCLVTHGGRIVNEKLSS